MPQLPILNIKILEILATRYGLNCTLEELTILLCPVMNATTLFNEKMSHSNEKQAKILEALIVLHDEGHLRLNTSNDNSSITIKGLIAISSKIFCN